MKVDAGGYAATVDAAADTARTAEAPGYDGWFAVETQIDPFLAAARSPRSAPSGSSSAPGSPSPSRATR